MWREQRRLSNASASGQWSPTSDWVRDTPGEELGAGVWSEGTEWGCQSSSPGGTR